MKIMHTNRQFATNMIRENAVSGKPVLVVGQHGDGKVNSALEAVNNSQYIDVTHLDSNEFQNELSSDQSNPIVLNQVDTVRPQDLSFIREFLSNTQRVVVAICSGPDVPSDLHVCFQTVINIT